MVIVIFCEHDKGGESHRLEIGFGTYGGPNQDMVNIMYFTSQHTQNTSTQYTKNINKSELNKYLLNHFDHSEIIFKKQTII